MSNNTRAACARCAALESEVAALKAKLPCGHPVQYRNNNEGGCEFCFHLNCKELCETLRKRSEAANAALRDWVNDLQAGMFINCVYCGHRYGPNDEVPAAMADVLKEHIAKCPQHPMSKLESAVAALRARLERIERRAHQGALVGVSEADRIAALVNIYEECNLKGDAP